MRQAPFLLRTVALLSVGVVVVHQLRYRLAFGGDADHALQAYGHGYLGAVAPLTCMLLVVAFAHLLRHLARGGAPGQPRRLARLWIVAAASLLVAFGVQELLEGMLAPGHPAGLAGVFGTGGWIAAPLALAVGGAIALLLRGAEQAAEAAARLGAGLVVRLRAVASEALVPAAAARAPSLPPLATRAAGRAPPVLA